MPKCLSCGNLLLLQPHNFNLVGHRGYSYSYWAIKNEKKERRKLAQKSRLTSKAYEYQRMSKKQYIGFVIIVVVFLGAIFYWHYLRPSFIKQNCYKEAREQIIKENSNVRYTELFEGRYNTYYKVCLQKKGL